MPTYEYACRDCGEHLEVVQSFHDDNLEVCPKCEGSLRRVFSPAGIIFKGSGFHSNDYARSSPEASDGNGSSSGSDDADTDSGDKEASDSTAEKSA